jgi:hypothetical protein
MTGWYLRGIVSHIRPYRKRPGMSLCRWHERRALNGHLPRSSLAPAVQALRACASNVTSIAHQSLTEGTRAPGPECTLGSLIPTTGSLPTRRRLPAMSCWPRSARRGRAKAPACPGLAGPREGPCFTRAILTGLLPAHGALGPPGPALRLPDPLAATVSSLHGSCMLVWPFLRAPCC